VPDDFDDATIAVMAHSLLGSVAVILGAAETLRANWHLTDERGRNALFDMIADQGHHVVEMLRDMATGLPADVEQLLRDLDAGGGELRGS
jgi:hypothetical protein